MPKSQRCKPGGWLSRPLARLQATESRRALGSDLDGDDGRVLRWRVRRECAVCGGWCVGDCKVRRPRDATGRSGGRWVGGLTRCDARYWWGAASEWLANQPRPMHNTNTTPEPVAALHCCGPLCRQAFVRSFAVPPVSSARCVFVCRCALHRRTRASSTALALHRPPPLRPADTCCTATWDPARHPREETAQHGSRQTAKGCGAGSAAHGRHLLGHDRRRACDWHAGRHHRPRQKPAQPPLHGKAGPVLRRSPGQGGQEDDHRPPRWADSKMVCTLP